VSRKCCKKWLRLPVELFEVLQQPIDQYPEVPWQLVAGVFDQLGNALVNVANALGDDQPELNQQPADLVA